MSEKRFDLLFTGVDGGPCPKCDHSGLLLADRGVYGGDRTLVHSATDGLHQCTVPMTLGWVKISLDGEWKFLPHEDAEVPQ